MKNQRIIRSKDYLAEKKCPLALKNTSTWDSHVAFPIRLNGSDLKLVELSNADERGFREFKLIDDEDCTLMLNPEVPEEP